LHRLTEDTFPLSHSFSFGHFRINECVCVTILARSENKEENLENNSIYLFEKKIEDAQADMVISICH
jgi:hypothetical protein